MREQTSSYGRSSGPSRSGGSRGPSSGPRTGGPGGRRDSRGGPGGAGGGRFERGPRVFKKKVCRFCEEKSLVMDYKDTEKLQRFVTEKGKILPRRISGNCARHQRVLASSVKRSRHSALMAFQVE